MRDLSFMTKTLIAPLLPKIYNLIQLFSCKFFIKFSCKKIHFSYFSPLLDGFVSIHVQGPIGQGGVNKIFRQGGIHLTPPVHMYVCESYKVWSSRDHVILAILKHMKSDTKMACCIIVAHLEEELCSRGIVSGGGLCQRGVLSPPRVLRLLYFWTAGMHTSILRIKLHNIELAAKA